MRKIEKQMLNAIAAKTTWHGSNTSVSMHIGPNGSSILNIFLHGNHIASVENGVVRVNEYTLKQWPTPTTKSRLRALDVNVTTKAGVTYLDGKAI